MSRHVRRGDIVKVLTGRDRGQEGEVMRVLIKENRVIVRGVNMVVKHQKPSEKFPEGGVIRKESAIHWSNVKVIKSYA